MGFLGIGGSTTGAVVSGVTSFASDYYENRDFTSAVINGAVSAGISLIWSAVDNIIVPKQNQKGYLKYMRKDYHDANRRISNMNLSFAEALPLRRAVNEEKNEIKELEKIINTKTPFVQKEDIINKEPKSVVDLVFQDLPKTNIINDDKLLSPIEVSEYIFKLLEEIETLKDKINKLEKQNT